MPNNTKVAAENAVIEFITRVIGDKQRKGLTDTPKRVVDAWIDYWGRGYTTDETPKSILKTFDSAETKGDADHIHPIYNEMVIQHGIQVYSHCEHHLAPFFGIAHVAYVPSSDGIVGLSKLARIVNHFARRLQVQERLCVQIADALEQHLSPHVGVMITCTHLCMVSRGVSQANATTTTTALRGNLYAKMEARTEFLQACRAAH